MIDEENKKMRAEMGIKEDIVDGSGNKKSADLALYIFKDLGKYATEKHNMALTIKYLNPQYAIRTAPANGGDANLCHKLANNAVHSI